MIRILIIAVVLVASSSAQARHWGTFSGWEVSDNNTAYSCTVAREHEGPGATILGVSIYVKTRDVGVALANSNWSIKDNADLMVGMSIDGVNETFAGIAKGFVSGAKRGFVVLIEEDDFVTGFGKGTGIKFFKEKDTPGKELVVIDYIDLDGTGAAVAALHNCARNQARRLGAEEAYRKRWEHIPTDPFAK